MFNSNLFITLLVGHLVGDYVLQNAWMANNKTKQLLPLLTHSLVYTFTLFIFSLRIAPLNYLALLLIFTSHVLLDNRRLVSWWVSTINKSPNLTWLSIVIDQTFHILVIYYIS